MKNWQDVSLEICGCESDLAGFWSSCQRGRERASPGLEDWASAKAAYRFLSNEHVQEGAILSGHFQATGKRFAAAKGPILIPHDTTEFAYSRQDIGPIGILHNACTITEGGRMQRYTVCGISMHSSLASQPMVFHLV